MEHGNTTNADEADGLEPRSAANPVTLDALDQHVLSRRGRQPARKNAVRPRGPLIKRNEARNRIEVYRLVGESLANAPLYGFRRDKDAVCWWTTDEEAAYRLYQHFESRIEVHESAIGILLRKAKG